MNSIASFVISLLAIFFLTVSGSAPVQARGFENGAEDGVCGKTDGCKCCGPNCQCAENCKCGGNKATCAKSGKCCNGSEKCCNGDEKKSLKGAQNSTDVRGNSEVFFQKAAYKSAKKGKNKSHCILGAACCKDK